MIPVGTEVRILPFEAAGCTNTLGRVVKFCSEECCPDSTGQPRICETHYVRYNILHENCNDRQCEVDIKPFCEADLVPVTTPPVAAQSPAPQQRPVAQRRTLA